MFFSSSREKKTFKLGFKQHNIKLLVLPTYYKYIYTVSVDVGYCVLTFSGRTSIVNRETMVSHKLL